MRYFPMFLDFADRPVLIAGGGEQAAQKLRLVGRTPARIAVMALALDDELTAAVQAERVRWVRAVYDEAEVDRAAAVFCASGCIGVDAWIAARVAARGGVVNVVDKPRLCTAITPSIVDRAPLVVAIGTEGAAPVMGQRVKTQVEAWLEPSLGPFLAGLQALRPRMAETRLRPSPRGFWNWIMDAPRARAAAGDVKGALAEVEAAIAAGRAPASQAGGRLTLVDLPASADLLSLRAVRRMQEADLLAAPEGTPTAVTDLARRDAERLVWNDWPGEALAAAVAAGARVVALVPPGLGPEGVERIGAARA